MSRRCQRDLDATHGVAGIGEVMMPTLLLTNETIEARGLSPSELRQQRLSEAAQRALGSLLAGRGFVMMLPIYVRELPNGEGFLLSQ